ncbi:MAG: tetratricopeptide repeat protein [Pirellulales bacterium]
MLRKGDEPIPGYRLAHFLGRGAFGEVWRVSAPGGTSAALKFIDLNGKQGLKEYRAVQRVKEVRHAHLLPIYAFWMVDQYGDVLSDDELEAWDLSGSVMPTQVKPELLHVEARPPATLVVAMLLGDKSLSERLDECRGPKGEPRGIPIDELLDYMEDAAKGIDFLNSPRHDLGDGPVALQHCDIKPQNLLLVGNSVLVCDFGLARVLGNDQRTKTALAGSPAYMAPEVIRNRKPSHQTDQYALAITYFELRTGRLPFDHESYAAVLDAHLRGKLDWSLLSEQERKIVAKATSLEPANRFATSLDLVRTLRRAIGQESGFASVGSAAGSTGPASHAASSVASPGAPSLPRETIETDPTLANTDIKHAPSDDADIVISNADTQNTDERNRSAAAADGALADLASSRETALVTQSTVDSTTADDEDDAAAAVATPADRSKESAKPSKPAPSAPPKRPRAAPAAQQTPRPEPPTAGRHGLSLALWLGVAGALAFAAYKYWPDTERKKPSKSPNTAQASAESGKTNGSGNNNPPIDKPPIDSPPIDKGDSNPPPIVPQKQTVRLHFVPVDSRVTVDGVAANLSESGELQLERLPTERIQVSAARDGFREFSATRTLAQWRTSGDTIRLEPLPVDYAAQGRDLLKKGRTPQAIEFLVQAIAAGHGSPAVYHTLGLARQQLGDDAAAVDEFAKAITADAKLADAYRSRAASYRNLKKWSEAIADLARYVELVPARLGDVADDRVDALAGRVYDSLAANRADDALRDAAQALEIAAERPAAKATALAARGAVRRKRDQLDDAIDDFRAAAKLNADIAGRVKPVLAEALLARGKMRNETAQQTIAKADSPSVDLSKLFDPAIEDLSDAIALAPSDESYSARGFAYNGKRDFDKAVADFNQALRINPRNVLALHNRGYAYNGLKKPDKAIEDLSAAIRLKPTDHPSAYANRGAAYLQLREFDKAIDDFTDAIRQSRGAAAPLKFGLALAFRGRGEQFEGQGRFGEALTDYDKALEHAASAPSFADELKDRAAVMLSKQATALALQGKVGDALNAAERYVVRYPDRADAFATRGYVYFKRQKYKEAIADYDKAIGMEPKNAKLYVRRGMVNAVDRNPFAAIKDYTAAIDLDKSLAEAYELRANAFDQRGAINDKANAAADRQKAAELSKSIPEAPPAPVP